MNHIFSLKNLKSSALGRSLSNLVKLSLVLAGLSLSGVCFADPFDVLTRPVVETNTGVYSGGLGIQSPNIVWGNGYVLIRGSLSEYRNNRHQSDVIMHDLQTHKNTVLIEDAGLDCFNKENNTVIVTSSRAKRKYWLLDLSKKTDLIRDSFSGGYPDFRKYCESAAVIEDLPEINGKPSNKKHFLFEPNADIYLVQNKDNPDMLDVKSRDGRVITTTESSNIFGPTFIAESFVMGLGLGGDVNRKTNHHLMAENGQLYFFNEKNGIFEKSFTPYRYLTNTRGDMGVIDKNFRIWPWGRGYLVKIDVHFLTGTTGLYYLSDEDAVKTVKAQFFDYHAPKTSYPEGPLIGHVKYLKLIKAVRTNSFYKINMSPTECSIALSEGNGVSLKEFFLNTWDGNFLNDIDTATVRIINVCD